MNGLDRVLIGFFLFGAIVATTSLFRGIVRRPQVQIEYLENGKKTGEVEDVVIYVDIEGAVMNPGVYSLAIDSRLKDLVVSAGGYSEKADRDYCEKNLNLAQVLKDGQKIYVPTVNDTPGMQGYTKAKTEAIKVNINVASLSELDTLWGVGPSRAEMIVKNRPYTTLEELVDKDGMTKQIFEKNRDRIDLY